MRWQVYTYSKDAETGLCNRHQQVDLIIFFIPCIIIIKVEIIIVVIPCIIIIIINMIRRSADSSSLATLFQGEIVKFSDYQKTEMGTEVEVDFHLFKFSTSSYFISRWSPPFQRSSSLHLLAPVLLLGSARHQAACRT